MDTLGKIFEKLSSPGLRRDFFYVVFGSISGFSVLLFYSQTAQGYLDSSRNLIHSDLVRLYLFFAIAYVVGRSLTIIGNGVDRLVYFLIRSGRRKQVRKFFEFMRDTEETKSIQADEVEVRNTVDIYELMKENPDLYEVYQRKLDRGTFFDFLIGFIIISLSSSIYLWEQRYICFLVPALVVALFANAVHDMNFVNILRDIHVYIARKQKALKTNHV